MSIYKTIGFDRPFKCPFKAKNWWRWAISSINKLQKFKDINWKNNLISLKSNKSAYINTYKKQLHNSLATSNVRVSESELKFNINLEENIFTFEQILIFREIAWEEVKRERDKQNSVGYLASLWSATSANLSESDKLQLTRSIDFDAKLKSLTIPEDYIQINLVATISSVSFNFLVPNVCNFIMQTSIDFNFKLCEKFWSFQLKIFDILIKDESVVLCKGINFFS